MFVKGERPQMTNWKNSLWGPFEMNPSVFARIFDGGVWESGLDSP